MYLERAEEYDQKMTDRWKADADGILVFVSAYFSGPLLTCVNSKCIDWSVFCLSRHIYRGLHPGPQAKLSGYLCLLSREYLSGARGYQHVWHLYPSHSIRSAPILPKHVCCLGQLSLVFKLGHKPYLRSAGYVATAVVTSLSLDHSASLQSSQAIADPIVLRRRCR